MIHHINEGMENPRPSVEVREIATWMHRKQSDRLARGVQQGKFSMMQTARGIKSGASRRKRTPLEDDHRPWESMGISRAWWYRKYRTDQSVD